MKDPSPPEGPPPLVSVVIPAYRAAAFIGETLRSVREQSFRDFEIIVVNDGSPDTAELKHVLREFEGENLRYLEQSNGGPSRARNAGIQAARGKYVAFLDGDDIWEPEYLSRQLAEMEAQGLDLVYCDASFFGSRLPLERSVMEKNPSQSPVTLLRLIRQEAVVITSCVVAERERLLALGGFDPAVRGPEDFDLWLRFVWAGGKVGFHRQVLARRRLHGESISSNAPAMFLAAAQVLERFVAIPGLSPEAAASGREKIEEFRHQAAWFAGKSALEAKRMSDARQAFAEAHARRPAFRSRIMCLIARLPSPMALGIYRAWEGLLELRLSTLRVIGGGAA